MDVRETRERLHDFVSPEQKDAWVAPDLAAVVLADPSADAGLVEAVAAVGVPVADAPERSAASSFAARAEARPLAAAVEAEEQ